ncbi:MAG: hypothetical protein IPF41_05385 [Flavobacteriales bacterium]|nr:hypothetical protein [Flavobacteriales bacterium]
MNIEARRWPRRARDRRLHAAYVDSITTDAMLETLDRTANENLAAITSICGGWQNA